MANIKSSEKDIRKSKKRRIANAEKKSKLRTLTKKVLKAVKANDKEVAQKAFIEFNSSIDKAAKTNLIHRKNADRKKSRMAIKINSIKKVEA